MNKFKWAFIILFPLILVAQNDSIKFYAGFRASRVLSSYPNNQFPPTEYWIRVAKGMAQKFPGSTPAGIWILSLYQGSGTTQLSFPSGGISIPNVQFTSIDYNESHLSKLDTSGVKVWLQVEPGNANIDTLISIVLNRYKHHQCVIGFGVDVEWYRNNISVTDSAAERWETKVRSIDSNYTLFLKHYGKNWMPPQYRGKILFVDDSQEFISLNSMVNEFKSWGAKFAPNRSAYQFGYKIDSTWWKQYADPTKTIGDALRSNIPSCSGVFWVDFTVTKVFPYTSTKYEEPIPSASLLSQNYPNPFNPTTTIQYELSKQSSVTITIYNNLGQYIAELINKDENPGWHEVVWNADVASGIYYYRIHAINLLDHTHRFSAMKKMLLLK